MRVSSNLNLHGTKFQSPQALWHEGGFDRITSDTAEKGRAAARFRYQC